MAHCQTWRFGDSVAYSRYVRTEQTDCCQREKRIDSAHAQRCQTKTHDDRGVAPPDSAPSFDHCQTGNSGHKDPEREEWGRGSHRTPVVYQRAVEAYGFSKKAPHGKAIGIDEGCCRTCEQNNCQHAPAGSG
jgi:hypothetical protein